MGRSLNRSRETFAPVWQAFQNGFTTFFVWNTILHGFCWASAGQPICWTAPTPAPTAAALRNSRRVTMLSFLLFRFPVRARSLTPPASPSLTLLPDSSPAFSSSALGLRRSQLIERNGEHDDRSHDEGLPIGRPFNRFIPLVTRVMISAPTMVPPTPPSPPKREVPPIHTAAIAGKSNGSPIVDSTALMRDTYTNPANAEIRPLSEYTSSRFPGILIPESRAASRFAPMR